MHSLTLPLQILKWNFQMPRPEHIDQLKDQLLNCVSFSLHKKLFHEDFKQQLSAISTLTQCISNPQYLEPTVGCCDLLLRWVTLKFFDTNTTVNIKCLELLHVLFQTLTSVEYRMNDYEAGAFLPYLVIKVIVLYYLHAYHMTFDLFRLVILKIL